VAQLQAAIDLDFTSVRIQSPYVAELKKIAGAESRIVPIDAGAIFRTCDNEALFADHVHPNEKGQALGGKDRREDSGGVARECVRGQQLQDAGGDGDLRQIGPRRAAPLNR
jgi:hypothetical protein